MVIFLRLPLAKVHVNSTYMVRALMPRPPASPSQLAVFTVLGLLSSSAEKEREK